MTPQETCKNCGHSEYSHTWYNAVADVEELWKCNLNRADCECDQFIPSESEKVLKPEVGDVNQTLANSSENSQGGLIITKAEIFTPEVFDKILREESSEKEGLTTRESGDKSPLNITMKDAYPSSQMGSEQLKIIRERMEEFCKDVFSTKNSCQCADCKFWRSHWLTIYDKAISETAKAIFERIEKEIIHDEKFIKTELLASPPIATKLALGINDGLKESLENLKKEFGIDE